jgi:hypothetical protein
MRTVKSFIRDGSLWALGAAIVVNEAFMRDEPCRLELILLAAVLLGLPGAAGIGSLFQSGTPQLPSSSAPQESSEQQ